MLLRPFTAYATLVYAIVEQPTLPIILRLHKEIQHKQVLMSYVLTANHTTTSICLLKTAIASIQSDPMISTTNILFDEGAQHLFITVKLAKVLQIIPTITEQVAVSSTGNTY